MSWYIFFEGNKKILKYGDQIKIKIEDFIKNGCKLKR